MFGDNVSILSSNWFTNSFRSLFSFSSVLIRTFCSIDLFFLDTNMSPNMTDFEVEMFLAQITDYALRSLGGEFPVEITLYPDEKDAKPDEKYQEILDKRINTYLRGHRRAKHFYNSY